MNVEIGAEAALFPGKEYINGIFVAVQLKHEGIKQILTIRSFGSKYVFVSQARYCHFSLLIIGFTNQLSSSFRILKKIKTGVNASFSVVRL